MPPPSRTVLIAVAALVVVVVLIGARRNRFESDGPAPAEPPAAAVTGEARAPGQTTLTAGGAASPAVATRTYDPIASGTHRRTLLHDGDERSYLLNVPPNYDTTRALPLVLVLHGGGGRAESVIRQSEFDAVAEREGFFVAYPNGSSRLDNFILTFNAGGCCGYAVAQGIDDVGFARAVVAAIEREVRVDERRIYVTGMSNGGMMTYRLACEAADIFAAAAPVSGTLYQTDCSSSEPISLIAFHGTADTKVLYEGGQPDSPGDGRPRTDPSTAESVAFFVQHNGCATQPDSTRSGSIVSEFWSGCTAGTAVALYTVEGGGHTWPGGGRGLIIGGDSPTKELSATETMWEFFAAHPKS